MPAETEALLRTIYTLAENRDISRLLETGDDDFSFSIPGVSVSVSTLINSVVPWLP